LGGHYLAFRHVPPVAMADVTEMVDGALRPVVAGHESQLPDTLTAIALSVNQRFSQRHSRVRKLDLLL
jgi:hypothetical protein